MNLNKVKDSVLGIIIISIIVLVAINKRKKNKKEIQADMQFTSGKIMKSSMSHRGGVKIEYIYYYNNIEYQDEETMGIYSGLKDVFPNKYFPVVFSGSQPQINQMLILPEDFDRYNLKYPDSLNWIKAVVRRSQLNH